MLFGPEPASRLQPRCDGQHAVLERCQLLCSCVALTRCNLQAHAKGRLLRQRMNRARKAAKLQHPSRPTTPPSLSARQLVSEHAPAAAAAAAPATAHAQLHDPLADLWDLDFSGESGEEGGLSIQSSFLGFGTRGSTQGDEAVCLMSSAGPPRCVMGQELLAAACRCMGRQCGS